MAQWPPKYATEVNWYLCVSVKSENLPYISLKITQCSYCWNGGCLGVVPGVCSHFSDWLPLLHSTIIYKWSYPPSKHPTHKVMSREAWLRHTQHYTNTHALTPHSFRPRWRHGRDATRLKFRREQIEGESRTEGREAPENWGRSPNRGREAPENWGLSPNRGRSPR